MVYDEEAAAPVEGVVGAVGAVRAVAAVAAAGGGASTTSRPAVGDRNNAVDDVERRALIVRNRKNFAGGHLNMSACAIRSAGILEEIPLKEAISRIANRSVTDPLWIDVEMEGDIKEELPVLTKNVLDLLDLTPFLRRHLAEPMQLQTPQVLPLSQSALVVMRIMGKDERETRYAAALCLESILLTVTSSTDEKKSKRIKKSNLVVGSKRESNMSNSMQGETLKTMRERELAEPTVSGAVALWFTFHLGRPALAIIKLRKTVYDLIDKSEDIEEIKLKEINDCKDLLLRFSSVAEEQLECVHCLEGGDAMSDGLDFTSPVLTGALSVILSTAKSTERSIGRLEKRVAELQAKYDSHQQSKINHRLNVLTIISGVFLPLTLLTGFWGMNWEHGMPAIRSEYGFYYALAGMISLALGLLLCFYRAGWMDR